MSSFDTLTKQLPHRHQRALRWFRDAAGQTVSWLNPMADGTLLVTRAKGIYKPAWSEYALSIRQSLQGPYPDEAPVTGSDSGWLYRYFQESLDTSKGQLLYTNRALLRNHYDRVPVGVLIQLSPKPQPSYGVLGVGLVEAWENGYFPVRQVLSQP